MSQHNNTIMEGNLTSEPELRFTNSGTPVCNLRIAQTDQFRRNGELLETTEYMNIVVWKDQAENVAMSLSTGDRVVVTGKVKQRRAEINGETRYFTELHADVVAVALRWAAVNGIERTAGKAAKETVPAGAPDTEEEPF